MLPVLSALFRSSNAEHVALHDGDAAGELCDVVMVDERFNHADHGRDPLVGGPQHDDAGVGAGRVGPHIPEASIQCDHESPIDSCCIENGWIITAAEGLVEHGVDIEVASAQQRDDVLRDVFVELDLQRSADRGRSSSRASSAP